MNSRIITIVGVAMLTGFASHKKKPTKIPEKELKVQTTDTTPDLSVRKIIPFIVNPGEQTVKSVVHSTGLYSRKMYDQISGDLTKLYKLRNSKPMWISQRGPKNVFDEMIRQINQAPSHGLSIDPYHLPLLKGKVALLSDSALLPAQLAKIDLLISAHYLLFSYHMANGRINPDELSEDWFINTQKGNLADRLARINRPRQLKSYFKKLIPDVPNYDKMKDYLRLYREIEENHGQFQPIPPAYQVETIEPMDRNPAIPMIRARLKLTDMASENSDSLLYDDQLTGPVKQFQRRHGLTADGRIGPDTFRAFNISLKDKIDLIKLNMERLRWIPSRNVDNYIVVNVPAYSLKVYKKKKLRLKMKVIVGKATTSTPVFTEQLEYLEFSPTWTVPGSIKSKEILPKLQQDPNYYADKDFKFYEGWDTKNEIDTDTVDWSQYDEDNFPFNVVQQPGSLNALGRVKFIMPNDLSIYLHDTPADDLFNQSERAFSHGCIRVEKPVDLALYLLRDQRGWDEEKINHYMQEDEPKRVFVKKDYQVQIIYNTCFVDVNGLINFREDIYGYDQAQLQQLNRTINTP